MKVPESCEGCEHCTWENFSDSGRYDPGFYCDYNFCPKLEEEYNAEIEGQVRDEE